MRSCPRCHTPHPDDARVCVIDGVDLCPAETAAPSAPQASGSARRPTGEEAIGSRGDEDRAPTARPAGTESVDEESTAATSPARRSGARGRRGEAGDERRTPSSLRGRREQAEDLLGEVLGSYRLVQVIGRGGMGRVYLAEHVLLGRRVALKLLRPEYAVKRDAVARFFQEAKAVNKIRHRNIVDVTDFVELEDGTTFIIMELLEGVSLGKLVRTRGQIAAPRLFAILIQVCEALEAAHLVGVVHRDLKPDNIFVCPDPLHGELAKLLDFGVAKLLTTDEETEDFAWHTAAGSVVGTPAYMSPEQAAGRPVDGRSDVYSLGAIMYELFCGQAPFAGRSFGDFVLKHMHEEPLAPRDTPGGGDVSPALEEIILRCLSKSPDDRYATVTALRKDLMGLLGVLDTGLIDGRTLSAQVAAAAAAVAAAPAEGAGVPPASASGDDAGPGADSDVWTSTTTPSPPGSDASSVPSLPPAGPPSGTPLDGPDARAAGEPLDEPTDFDGSPPQAPIAPGRSATALVLPLAPPAAKAPPRPRLPRPLALAGGAALLAALGFAAFRLALGGGDPSPTSGGVAARPATVTRPSGRGLDPRPPTTGGDAGAAIVAPMAAAAPDAGATPPGKVTLAFLSDPVGARVFAAGDAAPLCETPCDLVVDPADGGSPVRRSFVLRRSGYLDRDVVALLDGSPRQKLAVVLEEAAHRPPQDRDRDPAGPTGAPPVEPTATPPIVVPPVDPPPEDQPPRRPPDRIDPADTLDPFRKKPR